MFLDDRGLELTTESAMAAAAFNRTVREYFEYRLAAAKSAKDILAQDPDFVMGHCLRGYLFMLFGTTRVHDAARGHLAAAQAGADKGDQARKRPTCWPCKAGWKATCARPVPHGTRSSSSHPHDLLALRLQHFAYFWLGNGPELRNAPARVLESWDDSLSGYGYVLGMFAFGLEECGQYQQAERAGRRAVDMNPGRSLGRPRGCPCSGNGRAAA